VAEPVSVGTVVTVVAGLKKLFGGRGDSSAQNRAALEKARAAVPQGEKFWFGFRSTGPPAERGARTFGKYLTGTGPPPVPTAAAPGAPPPAWEYPRFDYWSLIGLGAAQAGTVIPGRWPGSKRAAKPRRKKRGRKETLEDYLGGARFGAGFGIAGEVVGEIFGIPSERVAAAEKAAEDATKQADEAAKRLREAQGENRERAKLESARRAADREADELERITRSGRIAAARDKEIKNQTKAADKALKDALKQQPDLAKWEAQAISAPELGPIRANRVSALLGKLPPGTLKYATPIVLGSVLKKLTNTSQPIGDVTPSPVELPSYGEGFQYGQSYLTSPQAEALPSLQPKQCICRTPGQKRKRRKKSGKRICYTRK